MTWAEPTIFHVAPIVEGVGEVEAVPLLIRRIAHELFMPPKLVDVTKPIRIGRGKLLKNGELERAVQLAAYHVSGRRGGVLVLIDADDDCPAELGPVLQARAEVAAHGGCQARVVLASSEFEGWFLAAAESLRDCRGLPPDLVPPPFPETVRDAKGWLTDRMPESRVYSPVLDQPALAASMSLAAAVDGSVSFEKFRREILRLLDAAEGGIG